MCSKLKVRSGPCNRCLFKVLPFNSAEQSKTTQILLGFFGWYAPWCGIIQIFLSVVWLLSCLSLTLPGLGWQLSGSSLVNISLIDPSLHSHFESCSNHVQGNVIFFVILVGLKPPFQLVQSPYSNLTVVWKIWGWLLQRQGNLVVTTFTVMNAIPYNC